MPREVLTRSLMAAPDRAPQPRPLDPSLPARVSAAMHVAGATLIQAAGRIAEREENHPGSLDPFRIAELRQANARLARLLAEIDAARRGRE